MKYNLINIKNFLQGYSRFYYDKYIGLPVYQKEQIDYRLKQCENDCAKTGHCIHCGCTFPDILSIEEWDNFKIKNDIK